MTAPAAPVLRLHVNADVVRCRWQPVPNATDYNIYVGTATAPVGLEAQVPDDDMGSDGWFQFSFREGGVIFVRMTALNVLAEESGYSNEYQVALLYGR